jgi:hypothetical protein
MVKLSHRDFSGSYRFVTHVRSTSASAPALWQCPFQASEIAPESAEKRCIGASMASAKGERAADTGFQGIKILEPTADEAQSETVAEEFQVRLICISVSACTYSGIERRFGPPSYWRFESRTVSRAGRCRQEGDVPLLSTKDSCLVLDQGYGTNAGYIGSENGRCQRTPIWRSNSQFHADKCHIRVFDLRKASRSDSCAAKIPKSHRRVEEGREWAETLYW